MSIEFESRVHAGHVELTCSGTYTLESSLEVYSRAFEIAAREARAAILVDAQQVTGTPPTLMDRFRMGMHVAKLEQNREPRIRVALLWNEPMIHPQRLGEIIAKSRGAQARVFTDRDEAMAWLNG
ncbi:MAG: hypothetical protein ACRER4_01325 [Steroidobacteraceae bacterium]